jgi:hypothetical protein
MPKEEGEDRRDQAVDLVSPEESPVRVPSVEPREPPAEEVVEDGEAEEEAEGGDARQGEGEGAGKGPPCPSQEVGGAGGEGKHRPKAGP